LTLRNRTGGGACATLAFPAVGASHEAAAE
jgi:hypothetical protein